MAASFRKPYRTSGVTEIDIHGWNQLVDINVARTIDQYDIVVSYTTGREYRRE